MKRISLLLLFAVAITVSPRVRGEQSPRDAKGFGVDKSFDLGTLDHVNLFNGNLTLTLPIGQEYPVNAGLSYRLNLIYTSAVWEIEDRTDTLQRRYFVSHPWRRSTAGLGWLLSLGRLNIPCRTGLQCDPVFTATEWQDYRFPGPDGEPTNRPAIGSYESPDAADHRFYPSLHDDEVAPTAPVVGYTRDGTFLRLLHPQDFLWHVEYPDGTVHVFEEYQPGSSNRTRLKEINDRFGNTISIVYTSAGWEIHDPHGRIQRVFIRNFDAAMYTGLATGVERIELTAWGAQTPETLTYWFRYDYTPPTSITSDPNTPTSGSFRTRRAPVPGTWDPLYTRFVVVPILTGIEARKGTIENGELLQEFRFEYYYDRTPILSDGQDGTPDRNGVNPDPGWTGRLAAVELPTGGRVDWTYGRYEHPDTSCDPGLSSNFGVFERTYTSSRAPNISSSTWTYAPQLISQTQPMEFRCGTTHWIETATPEVFTNTVTTPLGHRTVNYFSAWNARVAPPGGSQKRDFGLPFARPNALGDKFLSTEEFDCSESGCPKKRSTYVRYDRDAMTDHFVANRREAARRVVFHEKLEGLPDYCDAAATCRYTDVASSNYDGLGHYRQTDFTANFGNGGDSRTTYRNWNPGRGSYVAGPGNTFTIPSSDMNWVMNTYSLEVTSENGDRAASLSDFDPSTGFLRSIRIFQNAPVSLTAQPTALSTDLLTAFCDPNGDGNVDTENYFGGDKASSIPATPCTPIPDVARGEYGLEHTYSNGRRNTTRYRGLSPTIYTLNTEIDARTGLVTKSWDTSDIETSFQYDALGRLRLQQPTGRAQTKFTFNRAAYQSPPASVVVERLPAAGGLPVQRYRFEYDGLGRLSREFAVMPDQMESGRHISYDPDGRISSLSEFGRDSTKTHRSTYDAFGRVRDVTAPDNSVVKNTYDGIYSTSRETRVATPSQDAQDVVVMEVYDAQGRLRQVKELSGPTTPTSPVGDELTTDYGYDVGGRLNYVKMPGSGALQERRFGYDRRGFLTSETHPEVSTTTYSSIDSRGHAWQKTTGGTGSRFDLKYTFDAAERLRKIEEKNPKYVAGGIYAYEWDLFRPLKEFDFGEWNVVEQDGLWSYRKGKLLTATRYNHPFDFPSQQFRLGGTIKVQETYSYKDAAGRRTHRVTDISEQSLYANVWQPVKSVKFSVGYTDLDQPSIVSYPMCQDCGMPTTNPQRNLQTFYTNGFPNQVTDFVWNVTYWPNGIKNTVRHYSDVIDTQTVDPSGMPRVGSITFAKYQPCIRPSILTHPVDQTVSSGAQVVLRAAINQDASALVRYQWYSVNFATGVTDPASGGIQAVPGQDLVLQITATETRGYFVRVWNDCRELNSNLATVTVNQCIAPSITSITPSQTVVAGSSVSLSVTATGSDTKNYRWYRRTTSGSTEIATTSTHLVSSLSETSRFYVVVSNGCGSVTSDDVVITVPLAAPAQLVATRLSGTANVKLTWQAVPGASQYGIERRTGSDFVPLTTVTATTEHTDAARPAGTAAAYRVYALDANGGSRSPNSNSDIASILDFSPIAVGSPIDDVYLQEILGAVNAVRGAAALPAFTWPQILPSGVPDPSAGVPIRAIYITSLRSRMNEALGILTVSPPAYSDPDLTNQVFRVVHITQLQQAAQ
jgi:YD repeat-containing protein